MRTIKAILSTIFIVAIQLILPPFFKWYKNEYQIDEGALFGLTFLFFILSFAGLVMCGLLWASAIKNKDIKDFEL